MKALVDVEKILMNDLKLPYELSGHFLNLKQDFRLKKIEHLSVTKIEDSNWFWLFTAF